MKIKYIAICALIIVLAAIGVILLKTEIRPLDSQTAQVVLPQPDTTGGKPLMQTLAERRTNRSISEQAVSMQELSNILWAAWGINRQDGRRTAPTALNRQKVEVYTVLENGVWRYDAPSNSLHAMLAIDARNKYGDAPITLLYAAQEDDKYGKMHVGSLYQNVGLYCASAGLANVVKASGVNALKDELTLPDKYEVIIVQSIGWPK